MKLTGKRICIALTAVAVVTVFTLVLLAPRIEANKIALLGRGDYELQLTGGGTFTEETLKNGPTVVFFGFTHCPDICPTTMGDISMWKDAVPGAADLPVYFVSVDPQRDTLDLLGDYVSWVPGVQGATGSLAEAAKAVKSFDIYARRMDLIGGGYTMAHTSYVMLFDADGMFVETIPYQAPPEVAEEKLANLIAGNPAGRGAQMPDDLLSLICYTVQGQMI